MAGVHGTAAVVLAAGRGVRMGGDKAQLDLGGVPALRRVLQSCADAGVARIAIVRRRGAQAVPGVDPAAGRGPDPQWAPQLRWVEVDGEGDMTASLVAGREALASAGGCDRILVLPVDHAMVAADTLAAVLAALLPRVPTDPTAIALPLWRGRPGHPVGLTAEALAELGGSEAPTLRHVVRRDPDRVRVVPTLCAWTVRDLDTPEDHRAAQAYLRESGWPVCEQMHRHRSRRAFTAEPVPPEQVARLVDAARHASTSSFIQAVSIVSVRDEDRKRACAKLCGDQSHIEAAAVFLAVCADIHRLARCALDAGSEFAAGDFELFVQATVDAALVGQNLQLAAEAEGLGSCMIGAARNHPEELGALLGLPPHTYAVFGMTLGHPADDPVPRTRMPLSGVLHEEGYDRDAAWAAAVAADDQMRAWARAVNAGLEAGRPVDEARGWRDRMAHMWRPGGRYVALRAGLSRALARMGMLPREP